MVGFQTKLKHAEQVRVFRTIPGLAQAQFARLGGLHRNTFVNSPRLLDRTLRLKAAPSLASPARSPAARAMSKALPSGCWPAASPRPRHWASLSFRRRPRPRTARCWRISPAAPCRDIPADERQFRPVPAAARGHAQERTQGRHGAPGAGRAGDWPGMTGPSIPLAFRAKMLVMPRLPIDVSACPEPQDLVVETNPKCAASVTAVPAAEVSGGDSRRSQVFRRRAPSSVPGAWLAPDGAGVAAVRTRRSQFPPAPGRQDRALAGFLPRCAAGAGRWCAGGPALRWISSCSPSSCASTG